MEQRQLGPLRVSVVGLGCNNFGRRCGPEESTRVVRAALDEGLTLFDTADVYSGGDSETILGRALGQRRNEAVIATKFGGKDPYGDRPPTGGSPAAVRASIDASLRRLGTDRIELYQLHQPDDRTPIAETLGVLDELIHEGKIRAIGHSNFSGAQIEQTDAEAARLGVEPFACAQNEWSLLARSIEHEVVPAVRATGGSLLPYFPLSAGVLSGKYRPGVDIDPSWRMAKVPPTLRARFLDDEKIRIASELQRLAEGHGRTLLVLAVSWLAQQDVVASVIAGASTPQQVRQNAAAAGWQLDAVASAEVDRITRGLAA